MVFENPFMKTFPLEMTKDEVQEYLYSDPYFRRTKKKPTHFHQNHFHIQWMDSNFNVHHFILLLSLFFGGFILLLSKYSQSQIHYSRFS